MAAPKRAVSLAWGRGRELLLEAAGALFAERGFTAVSTKEIAERASVTEPMLFRDFGNKAKLFEEAVLGPFNEYISSYMADWENRPHGVLGPVHSEIPPLGAIIERFERVIRQERDERGFRGFDPVVQTRLMFGLVFAVAATQVRRDQQRTTT